MVLGRPAAARLEQSVLVDLGLCPQQPTVKTPHHDETDHGARHEDDHAGAEAGIADRHVLS